MTRKPARGFTLVELLVVIVIIALLAALLLPALTKALCSGRQGAAEHLIDNLTQATKMYETDQNAFPPSPPTYQSNTLVIYLKTQGAKKLSYFEFQPDMLDAGGNIRSTIRSTDILNYRNCAVNNPTNIGDPTQHNKQSVDIWTTDCSGSTVTPNDRVNNWD